MGHWEEVQQQQLKQRQEQQQLLLQLHDRQQQQQQHLEQQQQQQQEAPAQQAARLPSVPYVCNSSSSSSRSFFEWLKAHDDEQLWRCAWGAQASSSSSSSNSSSSCPVLVVDAGSHCVRVSRAERGPEGEEQSLILPQLIRKPWEGVGDGSLPGYRGTVKNWIAFEDALLEVLTAPDSAMHPSTAGGQFLWCESSLRSPDHFSRLGEICFELLDAEKFLSVDKDTLSALAICGSLLPPSVVPAECGESNASNSSTRWNSSALRVLRCMQHFTGLVIDMGASLTRVSPILSGQTLGCLAVELPLGGRDIDAFLCGSLLRQQQQMLKAPTERPCDCSMAAARSVKEQMLCCSTDSGVVFAAEAAFAKANPRSVYVSLPGCERCRSSSISSSNSSSRKRRCEEMPSATAAAEKGQLDIIDAQQQQHQRHQRESPWLVGDCRVLAAELLFDVKALTEYRNSGAFDEPLTALHLMPLQAAVELVVQRCPIDTRK
ncbi:auxin response factor 6 [Cyclospora cayetanensis]|uniref:Auxin response factor 6 n=1 Tax=Cyclospora cayetanensis TaxID=88456 RepID=A0A6P6S2H6_9EIME|nr:auxin response factor 6 [Cyclospora cayetanensis]